MQVTIRTLKARLSEYVRRAERGETVVVTSHGRVVATLAPPPGASVALKERLAGLPWVRSGRASGAPLGLREAVRLQGDGPTLTELLHADRE
ncbi:MAG: type II toxin-antitoxin system prevent-host-death family antitoxin [Xanthomonadales bacterium]|nr:type II toxin-antitoxin system prevent-host-death family antitoxin [Xanthomonadales bacterium]